jgi:hypothetical protein
MHRKGFLLPILVVLVAAATGHASAEQLQPTCSRLEIVRKPDVESLHAELQKEVNVESAASEYFVPGVIPSYFTPHAEVAVEVQQDGTVKQTAIRVSSNNANLDAFLVEWTKSFRFAPFKCEGSGTQIGVLPFEFRDE